MLISVFVQHGLNFDVDSTVISFPAEACKALKALGYLCVGYMYPLATYLHFCPGGILYPCCPIDNTMEVVAEAEATIALASSYLEKKFRSHYYKSGEIEE